MSFRSLSSGNTDDRSLVIGSTDRMFKTLSDTGGKVAGDSNQVKHTDEAVTGMHAFFLVGHPQPPKLVYLPGNCLYRHYVLTNVKLILTKLPVIGRRISP